MTNNEVYFVGHVAGRAGRFFTRDVEYLGRVAVIQNESAFSW